MAVFQGTIRSRALDMDTKVNVILPYDYYDAQGNPKPVDKVLYLLHGLKQNADAWLRYASAERYANYYGYALVVPEVQRSWYCDVSGDMHYFRYIAQELPGVMHAMFRLPQGREHTFIGGLSMGGYGALKCALTYPERYAGAMCFSSAFYTLERDGARMFFIGPGPLKERDDTDHLIRTFPEGVAKPRLYVACGTEDGLFEDNERARDALIARGFDVAWEAWSGGHDWKFWDAALAKGTEYFCRK